MLISSGLTMAEEGTWPWQAYFSINFGILKIDQIGCIGTLLNPEYIITAAHCVHMRGWLVQPSKLEIHIGKSRKSVQHNNIFKASEIKVHPDYGKHGKEGDLAIIRLTKPVQVGKTVRPICISSSPNRLTEGTKALLISWGRTSERR